MIRVAVTLIATLIAAAAASAAPGSLDSTFGAGGKTTTSFGTGSADIYALVLQPDGKLVAAGSDVSQSAFALVRYNANGSLDPTFGMSGTASTPIGIDTSGASALVLQSDGKLVAAGNAWKDSVDADFAVVRYNTNGSLDATFGAGGKVTTSIGSDEDDAYALALQPDGKLVAAGVTLNGFRWDFALVRYNANGSLDTTFGTGGTVITSIGTDGTGASALVLQPDGKLVAAGTTTNDGSAYDFTLVRYNANGSLDATFGTGGKVTTPIGIGDNSVSALVLQADGKLVAAGYALIAGTYDFTLVRYNTNGSLDATFGTGGKVTTPVGSAGDYADALLVQPDGKLVAAGNVEGSDRDFAVVRYNADGSLDGSFGTGGKVITPLGSSDDVAFSLVLQPDGKLVAGGYATNGSNDDFALVRYLGQVCGDAIVAAPEQCDAGAANGTASSCCTGSCQFATAGTTCTGGHCDGTGDCLPAPTTTITTTSTTTTTAPPTTTSTTTSTATSTTATSTTTSTTSTTSTTTTTTATFASTTTTTAPSTTSSTTTSTTTTTTATTATSTTSTTTAQPTTTTSSTTSTTSITGTTTITSTTTMTEPPTATSSTESTTTSTTASTTSTTGTASTTSSTTTSASATTTTSSSSTTMASTTTTSTTTLPHGSTTSTTLPCPDSDIDGVTCVLRAAAHAPECAGDVIPAPIQRRVDQATTVINRGAAATSATKERKFVRQAATLLKKAAHLTGSAGRRGKVSPACSGTLAALLDDAGNRAARFAATL